jgi:predicted MarR family transcription regulator
MPENSKSIDIVSKNHLAPTADLMAVAAYEVSLFAIFEAIHLWQEKCLEASGGNISGPENTLLNVIRINDKPKALSDVAQFLNRTDLSNIQYAIRKLQKQGLIQKSPGKSKNQRKDVTYEVTEAGYALTEKFGLLRAKMLEKAFKSAGFKVETLDDMRQKINTMVGIYESVSREIALLPLD